LLAGGGAEQVRQKLGNRQWAACSRVRRKWWPPPDYRLIEGRPFDRYGLEQQAELVRHHFLASQGKFLAQLPESGFLPFTRPVTQSQQS
jgi:hypothetical protein